MEVISIDAKDNLIRMVKEYQNLIFSICLKLTGDYFASEDISQNTFLTAYLHYQEFDGSNEKAWICRIASNQCIDYLRKKERKNIASDHQSMELLEESQGVPDKECLDPLRIYEGKEIMKQMENACQCLPEPYDEIAYRYFIEGMNAREIAEKKQMNLKTVQTQIYRAREMIRKYVRREDLIS